MEKPGTEIRHTFSGELLDQLLVFVEFLQVVGAHGIYTMMLGSVDIVLVAQDASKRRHA